MGGTKKKKFERGAVTAFISRNKALRKLQLSLSHFRTLCIFKGVYPVEPLHKKKVNRGSTSLKTYYNLKDIQFLAHEPIIKKFREKKHYLRKLKKAVEKKNFDQESIIRDNKPVYSLKSIIKERYPTFTDALRDLDDCLNLCFCFGSFPVTKQIHAETVALCRKRVVEFQHYVIASKALRKVFVSIKGIYYQADIKNETITWLVSHKRGYEHPQDVDYKVMATFAEYHSVLLGNINIKLFSDRHLLYPPKVVESAETSDNNFCVEKDKEEELLACLAHDVRSTGETVDDYKEDEEVDQLNAASAEYPDVIEKSKLEAESVKRLQSLFKGLKFFLNREVPREELTFVIRCCGGHVSWDSSLAVGATYKEDDKGISHHILDRNAVSKKRLTRTYIQPQWVFDCVNARRLIPAKDYFPGVPCPPHLSPFVEEREGDYIPEEKVKFLKRQHRDDVNDEDSEEEKDDDEEEKEDENENSISKSSGPAKQKRRHEESEEPEENAETKSKVAKMSVSVGKKETNDQERQLFRQKIEERRLGEMMIPKKDRRLYKKIMYSRKKTKQEAQKLQDKKDKIVAQKKKDKKLQRKKLTTG